MRQSARIGLVASAMLSLSFVTFAQQKDKDFPTDEEIKLVVTQTDRATEQYELTVAQEETLLVSKKSDAEDVAQDRQLIQALKVATAGFKAKPQAFNSELGLEFVLMLDDASRNAALCTGSAGMNITTAAMDGKAEKAGSILQLARACTDVSTLLYTVSESASALYKRYVEAEQSVAEQSVALMQKCTAILKQQSSKNRN